MPYETRLEIAQRNLSDAQLQDDFYKQCSQTILKYLNDKDAQVKNLVLLINDTIHKIFYQQGLEFSNFILHGKSEDSIEKDLRDTIGIVVDQSSVIEKNKEIVKTCLLMAIRDIVYNGTIEQKKYFQSLSNTYMMMFMLQWNPQIALYFESMASRLNIYVCTSIIIPALSEYYLDEQNRRHWNLLMSAKEAGVKLYITDAIIDELVSHFYMIKNKYESIFKEDEEYYLLNDIDSLYIDEIMIRAYFHAKFRGNVYSFQDFINNFCSPYLINTKEELVDFLKNQFDIQYTTDEYLNVKINTEEHERLSSELEVLKKNANKAQTDAEVILTIYKLRERANEASQTGIYGYKTWWLSKDTSTYRVVEKLFVKKYPVSCYMRPDFLYNYITLAPKKFEVDNMYKQLFPSLIGINLSFHMPREISEYIQQEIKEHGSKNPARMKAIIRQLTDRLKSDPNCRNRRYVEHFLDQQRKTLFQHQ